MPTLDIDYTNLIMVLAFLAGPAGITWWMFTVSTWLRNLRSEPLARFEENPYLLRLAGWVRTLTPMGMYNLTVGLMFSLPVIASLALGFVPAEWILKLQPVFATFTGMVAIFLVVQGYYQLTKERPQPPVTLQAVAAGGPAAAPEAPKALELEPRLTSWKEQDTRAVMQTLQGAAERPVERGGPVGRQTGPYLAGGPLATMPSDPDWLREPRGNVTERTQGGAGPARTPTLQGAEEARCVDLDPAGDLPEISRPSAGR